MEILAVLGIMASLVGAIYAYKTYEKMQHPDGIDIFEKYLEDKNNWKCKHSGNEVHWLYLKNVDYEFILSYAHDWLSDDPWIPSFPDSSKSKEIVKLYIKGKIVSKEIPFISLDGGRFLIPVPKIGPNEKHYWEENSLEFKLDSIIGLYTGGGYPSNIKEFSERYNIPII